MPDESHNRSRPRIYTFHHTNPKKGWKQIQSDSSMYCIFFLIKRIPVRVVIYGSPWNRKTMV
uniref:Uncharacterized protein n=1 Tax=Arundo donax TaxID=35708 RepID=A0A0A9FUT7_ARUDO